MGGHRRHWGHKGYGGTPRDVETYGEHGDMWGHEDMGDTWGTLGHEGHGGYDRGVRTGDGTQGWDLGTWESGDTSGMQGQTGGHHRGHMRDAQRRP